MKKYRPIIHVNDKPKSCKFFGEDLEFPPETISRTRAISYNAYSKADIGSLDWECDMVNPMFDELEGIDWNDITKLEY